MQKQLEAHRSTILQYLNALLKPGWADELEGGGGEEGGISQAQSSVGVEGARWVLYHLDGIDREDREGESSTRRLSDLLAELRVRESDRRRDVQALQLVLEGEVGMQLLGRQNVPTSQSSGQVAEQLLNVAEASGGSTVLYLHDMARAGRRFTSLEHLAEFVASYHGHTLPQRAAALQILNQRSAEGEEAFTQRDINVNL